MNKSPLVLASIALTFLLSNAAAPAYAMGNGSGNNGNGNGNNGNSAAARGIFEQEQTNNGRGQGRAVGQGQQQRLERELQAAAREERKELKKLSRKDLQDEAEAGGRLAQLVLAEELADEAQLWVDMPAVANDAFSEAIQWYATAAQRGTPGSLAIDTAIPSPAIRAVRDGR